MANSRQKPLDETPAFVPIADLCAVLNWEQVFPAEQPVEIDLGAGDGGFIAERARQFPGVNFLAVERLLGRARKIARKAVRLGLPNLKVLRLESAYALKYLVPPGSVRIIHLMFPDPWPKRKHRKYRLIQPAFVESLARALELGGEFRFTTDHHEYFLFGSGVISERGLLDPAPVWDFSIDPLTDFQRDFLKEGRAFYRALWRKLR
jgi:tRNA (guanine-N7-)-methyltransferase